jgi:alpha-beta hydrolase superfamily lysophospholipase
VVLLIHLLKFLPVMLTGFSMLLIGGQVFGEMFATMAPIYSRKASLSVYNLGILFEEVTFPSSAGLALRGWFFPAEDQNAPAIIYAPATSRDQRSGISLVKPFHEAGYHVLLFSYRGHGNSDGSRFGFTYGAVESQDVDAAVRYLYETRGIERIGAIGHSAGAVSIILSAARNPRIAALVAASPFTTVEAVWETNRPKIIPKPVLQLALLLSELRKGFSRQDVRPQDVIQQIAPRPLLLVHGNEDQRITKKQVTQLYDSAMEPKMLWMVPGASHAEVRSPVLDELTGEIINFFDTALRSPLEGDVELSGATYQD